MLAPPKRPAVSKSECPHTAASREKNFPMVVIFLS